MEWERAWIGWFGETVGFRFCRASRAEIVIFLETASLWFGAYWQQCLTTFELSCLSYRIAARAVFLTRVVLLTVGLCTMLGLLPEHHLPYGSV